METSSKRERLSFRRLPSIPEDILIEILLRLEVKPLVRFRSVSKAWYTLIKSPKFISEHHNLSNVSQLLMCTGKRFLEEGLSNNNDHVFSFRSNDKFARVLRPDLEIPGDHAVEELGGSKGGESPPVLHLKVAGSCNGIVCVYSHPQEIILSNPATREFKKLPCTSIMDQNLVQIGVSFGYNSPIIYDFKVLRVFGIAGRSGLPQFDPKTMRAEMFTLSSNTWKQLDWGVDKRITIANDCGLFCANSFHFIVGRYKAGDFSVVSCDIHTERFTTIDFPSTGVRGIFYSLIRFKEFLSAVFRPSGLKSEEVWYEIWIMKDYGVVESWTKLYRIGPPLGSALQLCFWMDDHALLLVQHKDANLASCHLNTLSLERIKIDGYTVNSGVVIHKESLVSIM